MDGPTRDDQDVRRLGPLVRRLQKSHSDIDSLADDVIDATLAPRGVNPRFRWHRPPCRVRQHYDVTIAGRSFHIVWGRAGELGYAMDAGAETALASVAIVGVTRMSRPINPWVLIASLLILGVLVQRFILPLPPDRVWGTGVLYRLG